VGISWVQKITNWEVLARMGKSKELMLIVKEKKTRYISHLMRGERYELRLIIEGKRSVKRKQHSWLKDMKMVWMFG